MSTYSAKVVGMFFREREGVPAKAIVGNMLPGAELQLEREPDNQYDAYAIKVLASGEHIGYIEKEHAAFIAPDMDDGADTTCTVTGFIEIKNNNHPLVEIKTSFAD